VFVLYCNTTLTRRFNFVSSVELILPCNVTDTALDIVTDTCMAGFD
jgi:hypothetical protein